MRFIIEKKKLIFFVLISLGGLVLIIFGVAFYYEKQKSVFQIIDLAHSIDQGSLDMHSANSGFGLPENTNFEIKLPILMYHYIEPISIFTDKLRKSLTVSPENFSKQLVWLKENGYTTINFSELFEMIGSGEKLPEKSIILTFDDGYAGIYDYAIPLMKNLGQTGVFFIISDYVGQDGYMIWQEIKEISKLGFEIGSHSKTHPNLTKVSPVELEVELVASKEALEGQIGRPVDFFCYPAGNYDDRIIGGLMATKYKAAVTTKIGSLLSSKYIYEMPRLRITDNIDIEGFAYMINSSLQQ